MALLKVPEEIFTLELTCYELAIYLELCRAARLADAPRFSVSVTSIAHERRCSVPTVRTALTRLASFGLVIIVHQSDENGAQVANAYELTAKELWDGASAVAASGPELGPLFDDTKTLALEDMRSRVRRRAWLSYDELMLTDVEIEEYDHAIAAAGKVEELEKIWKKIPKYTGKEPVPKRLG